MSKTHDRAPVLARDVAHPRDHPQRGASVLLVLGWVLVVLGVVSWRRGVLFTGAVDPVVLAKAVVSVLAAGCALGALFLLPRRARRRPPLLPLLLVAAIVAVSLVGAASAGHVGPAAVLAGRLLLLAATTAVLACCAPPARSMALLLAAMGGVGLVSALTGAAAVLLGAPARERLQGGFPGLEPNELAALLVPAAIGLLFLLVRRGLRPAPVVALVILLGLTVWTGSRTGVAVLLIGAVVVLLFRDGRLRLPSRRVLAGVGAAAVLLVGGLVLSGALAELVLRGEGLGRLLSLNSRTIAWREVFATPPGSWAWWTGRGLDVKTIAVHGQYWDRQVFDSSWVSALAQTGVIGAGLTAAYVITAFVGAARGGRFRALFLAIAVSLTIRSVVENGLVESSTTFALFLLLALASRRVEPERSAAL